MGNVVSSNDPEARYLWQQDNSAWVGPLARRGVDFWGGGRRRNVDASWGPDGALGVVGQLGRFAAAPNPTTSLVANGFTTEQLKTLLRGAREEVNVLSLSRPAELKNTATLIKAIEIKE
jgi:hypothetical protein